MEEEDKSAVSCKVVLIGESGVGKTSIISRFITNTFSSILMSTTGASFATKSIYLEKEDRTVKFEIWDTAGQEKYRSLAKVFYKNAQVCLLVYDISRKTSLDEIKNYWFKEIKNNATDNIILALAGNKSDMYEFEEVSDEEAKNYAKEINAIFQKTSAKTDVGVNELFKMIGQKVVNPQAENTSNLTKDEQKKRGDKLKKDKIKKENNSNNKNKCCA
jgi:small GTP-binding protein